MQKFLKGFFRPRLDRRYALRVAIMGGAALFIFGVLLKPAWINGQSMEPTYHDGGFLLIVRHRYRRQPPATGDVVAVRYAGEDVMMLKRVVATAGQTIGFRQGTLWRDGKLVEEPYVSGPCDWDLPPRTVRPGHLYVVGDNRSMPIEQHLFGQVNKKRLTGGPLW